MGLSSGSLPCRAIAGGAINSLLLVILLGGASFPAPSLATDTLVKGQSIATNGSLISNGGIFRLGFFTRGSPGGYYLGILYNNISVETVVWVANRESPADAAGLLRLGNNGRLEVVDGSGGVRWSSNSTIDSTNCSAQIGNDGNLILKSGNSLNSILWQSFDHPGDTFIPGMKITMDRATGAIQRFISWTSPEDPAPGRYSLGLDPLGSAQIYIWNGSAIRWRSGQWNKRSFIGITRMKALSIYGFSLDPNNNGQMVLSFSYEESLLRFVMQSDGIQNTSTWNSGNQSWTGVWAQPLTDCETYNFCGNYSLCDEEATPKCSCLQGFLPKSDGEWGGGCVRRTPLGCAANGTGGATGFATFEMVKLPDFSEWASTANDEAACGAYCSANCSCAAYSFVEDLGCLVWSVDLVDLAKFITGGNTLHLKLDSNDLDESKKRVLSIVLPVVLVVILLLCLFIGWKYMANIKDGPTKFSDPKELEDKTEGDSPELPVFSFEAIAVATDNFSNINKLGEGGFGDVHKGVLPSGEEIAVKRLSRSSGQGLDEFKNEVTLIAKLQHRNLVRLLGYCFQGDEKVLIYEYLPNRSLDVFLFDPVRRPLLDWRKRFDILEGIARGLLYLHRDSRLRIVHRDLKASNILLDEEMNPKISDFGMARIFGGNQNHDNTNRVVGTFGYMSPEYAMEGLFSVKSDVYSFGVLMLEIVTGRKNSRTRSENYTNLLGYVWQLWTEGRAQDLIDPCIMDCCDATQALRCVHVALLCVQDRPYDRPTMSSVVIMLSSQNPLHEFPKQPTFVADGSPSDTESQKHNGDGFSVNDVTVTMLAGR
ncbi:unnamed protein product [Spirodela intermedia]|uniref:Receptor-like serine/threonine-protein kinase n=1 Tax=Spirodela intermedia TaxID=51605 RepID=A0A7I8KBP0_SPIIN|nr:unnamed protein product [Spirodela intermedia]